MENATSAFFMRLFFTGCIEIEIAGKTAVVAGVVLFFLLFRKSTFPAADKYHAASPL